MVGEFVNLVNPVNRATPVLTGQAAKEFLQEMNRERTPEEIEEKKKFLKECDDVYKQLVVRSVRKILFVCSANIHRSKAFEREFKEMYKENPNYEIRSAGLYSSSGYGYPLNHELVEWANEIYVMTLAHKRFFHKQYPEHLDKVTIIGISDQYDVDDEELKELVHYWHIYYFRRKK